MPWFSVRFERTIDVPVFANTEHDAREAAIREASLGLPNVDPDSGDWDSLVDYTYKKTPNESDMFVAVKDEHGRPALKYAGDSSEDAEAMAVLQDKEAMANIECKLRHGIPIQTDPDLLPRPDAAIPGAVGAAAVGFPEYRPGGNT